MFKVNLSSEPSRESKQEEIKSLAHRGKEAVCQDIIEAVEDGDAFSLMLALERFMHISKLLDDDE